jgi:hypothetical protein
MFGVTRRRPGLRDPHWGQERSGIVTRDGSTLHSDERIRRQHL